VRELEQDLRIRITDLITDFKTITRADIADLKNCVETEHLKRARKDNDFTI